MVNQCPVSFRFGLYLLPFRIGLESGPIFLRLGTAGMLQNVDKQVLRTRRIFRRPVPNTVHVVPLEDRVGVITKAISKSVHFTFVNMVEPQFVNVVSGFRVGYTEGAQAEHGRGAAKKR